MTRANPLVFCLALLVPLLSCAGCGGRASRDIAALPGQPLPRRGDEIVACGQFFHTGAPVVLWLDPGGYDAYRVERRFAPPDAADWDASRQQVKELKTPNRYGQRKVASFTPEQQQHVRERGWDLPLLQQTVDQFVLHYDAAGTSRMCFNVLHDRRGLSVHFMLDLDGTIYQTLDLKERAWHATTSNDRSIGIEIANIGAYPEDDAAVLKQWYRADGDGTRLIIPLANGFDRQRDARFAGRPMRPRPVVGVIQGRRLVQYDLTPQQYDSLIKLTAALCTVFPKIRCDYPRDANGQLVSAKLPDEQLENYHGILGHYHVQAEKLDPGPAMQWDYLIDHSRAAMAPRQKERRP